MATVGWLDSPTYDKHSNGVGHPECPERLHAVREALSASAVRNKLVFTEALPVAQDVLERIHTARYVSSVETLCKDGGGYLDPDTSVVTQSWDAAVRAAGAVTHAVEKVLDGDWQRAFCSVRPPGHHAPKNRAMGFCLFDNVAVGAEAALLHGLERVAILDWDVHHGNGTQDIFYERDDVFFASWHQFPFYPGTGSSNETGAGAGKGFTLNCPVGAGGGDAEYLAGWNEQIRPALEKFRPELVMISAGFDADKRDPLAGLNVTPNGFEQLSASVVQWAEAHCNGRVVSVLEGGYNLEALGEDVRLHVETLVG